LNFYTNFEPTSFEKPASHDEWKDAMQEYNALIKNGTWKLVDPPFETKPIGCKWVFKNMYKSNDSLDKHKARLVENRFAQKERVDYEEIFSPTTKWATIRVTFLAHEVLCMFFLVCGCYLNVYTTKHLTL
jgi:hypothetical protein